MPFVNAKCPNCSGSLQVDNGKRAAICPFCKEAYIVEDAINNYITNYNTNIEHLHADVVNISSQKDFEIRAGELVTYKGESTDVVIPNNVSRIGYIFDHGHKGAFSGCTQLRSVVIPDSVTEIGQSAFSGCKNLQRINIPRSVSKIEMWAFSGCSSLIDITLPPSVTEARNAFAGCNSLKKITICGTLTASDILNDCQAEGVEIRYDNSINSLTPNHVYFRYSPGWGDDPIIYRASAVYIPDSVTSIEYSFGKLIPGSKIRYVTQKNEYNRGSLFKKPTVKHYGTQQECYKIATEKDIVAIRALLESSFSGTQEGVRLDRDSWIPVYDTDLLLYEANIVVSSSWKQAHTGELKHI